MAKKFCVYILTNRTKNVLYIGITSNLCQRIQEHKKQIFRGFTKKYNVNKLVYFETYNNPIDVRVQIQTLHGHCETSIPKQWSKQPKFREQNTTTKFVNLRLICVADQRQIRVF